MIEPNKLEPTKNGVNMCRCGRMAASVPALYNKKLYHICYLCENDYRNFVDIKEINNKCQK